VAPACHRTQLYGGGDLQTDGERGEDRAFRGPPGGGQCSDTLERHGHVGAVASGQFVARVRPPRRLTPAAFPFCYVPRVAHTSRCLRCMRLIAPTSKRVLPAIPNNPLTRALDGRSDTA